MGCIYVLTFFTRLMSIYWASLSWLCFNSWLQTNLNRTTMTHQSTAWPNALIISRGFEKWHIWFNSQIIEFEFWRKSPFSRVGSSPPSNLQSPQKCGFWQGKPKLTPGPNEQWRAPALDFPHLGFRKPRLRRKPQLNVS